MATILNLLATLLILLPIFEEKSSIANCIAKSIMDLGKVLLAQMETPGDAQSIKTFQVSQSLKRQ